MDKAIQDYINTKKELDDFLDQHESIFSTVRDYKKLLKEYKNNVISEMKKDRRTKFEFEGFSFSLKDKKRVAHSTEALAVVLGENNPQLKDYLQKVESSEEVMNVRKKSKK